MDIFRIVDKIQVTGRGTVYLIKYNKGAVVRTGSELFDLQGNRFSVRGIEMIRYMISDIPVDERPLGILLEPLSETDVSGNILINELPRINFLFCSHPLYPEQVDEDYMEEYRTAGIDHECALFSYENFEEGKLSLYGDDISGLTIYRGWMMRPEMYKKLYLALEGRGIILINSPDEYDKYHMLPGWYKEFSGETPESAWTAGGDIEDVLHLAGNLDGGAYIVKDYVKSRKHEWYDACFIQNIADRANVQKIVTNFIDRQGEDLVGGVVFRRYENLRKAGFHKQSGMPLSEEYRVFIYAGKILIMDYYWDAESGGQFSEEETGWIKSIAGRIRSNFVTVDLARKEDGSLIIMEFGDGQVSGLQQITAEKFYEAVRDVETQTYVSGKKLGRCPDF